MIVAVVAIIVTAVCASYAFYKVLTRNKFYPCDSCKYLKQKNGPNYKYKCECHNISPSMFDKAPSFCRYYKKDELSIQEEK